MSKETSNAGDVCAESSSSADGNSVSIASFFDRRVVFVTGVSGFLGKVLLEKLLRSCPGVEKVYVLIREKRGKDGKQRISELLAGKCFERVKEQNPKALEKVAPILGDLASPNLGISDGDRAALVRDVSVVFHAAATVRFDEPLRTAVQLNLAGTASVVQMCKEMPQLAAFVYVSTAFCNCERKVVEEKIYPAPVDPEKLLEAASWLDVEAMDGLYEKIKGEKVNTYIFTKALAESYLEKNGKDLPVAIFRPSIVGNSWKEPYPGWVDAVHGAGGAILAVAAGAWRNSYSDPDALAHGIPVDLVVNCMLAVAWDTARNHKRTRQEDIKVFNFDSVLVHPCTWARAINKDLEVARAKYCLENAIWYPTHRQETSWAKFKLLTTVNEALPAYLTDLATKAVGGKPMAVRIYKKIQQTTLSLRYFMMGQWEFRSDNVPKLLADMSPEDRKMFNIDVKGVCWDEYASNCVYGFRTYFMKQDPATIPRSIKRMQKLKMAWIFVRLVQLGLLLLLVSKLLGVNLLEPVFFISQLIASIKHGDVQHQGIK